jgi:hypothetical protein
MDFDNYKTQFEEFVEDADLTVSDNTLNKIARRAIDLEKEVDFSLDDIKEEIIEVIPIRFQHNKDWLGLVDEISLFIFDEKENNDDTPDYDE